MTTTQLSATDPRFLFAKAVATARATIARVTPDQMDLPTPCTEFNTKGLLGHMLCVFRRTEAAGSGDNPMAIPEVFTDIADDAWDATFLEAAHQVQAAWTDDATLEQIITLPWAQMPGSGILNMYMAELTTHTWDLAKATGQQPDWDDNVLTAALALQKMILPPGDRGPGFKAILEKMPEAMRNRPLPFQNAVPVPDDAPMIDQLVAWTGRQP
jgi:uncharacterized protein (TIGR03086 family)